MIVYGFARRIENTQCANSGKFEVFSISPYEKMASPEREVYVPNEKIVIVKYGRWS